MITLQSILMTYRKLIMKFVIIILSLSILFSCQEHGKSFSEQYITERFNSYYDEDTQELELVYQSNEVDNGWMVSFDDKGNVINEGIIRTNEKFSKHIYFSYPSDMYILKIYYHKNEKQLSQQLTFYDNNLEQIDTLGKFISFETKLDTTYLSYYNKGCPVDSFKVFGKKIETKTSVLNERLIPIVGMKLTEFDNYLLESFCSSNSEKLIYSNKLIFNKSFGCFNQDDLNILLNLKMTRQKVDIRSFFIGSGNVSN